jgi:hypothetical protein
LFIPGHAIVAGRSVCRALKGGLRGDEKDKPQKKSSLYVKSNENAFK